MSFKKIVPALVLFFCFFHSHIAVAVVEAYTYPPSVIQGQKIAFYISTDSPTYDVHIYREGVAKEQKFVQYAVPGRTQATNIDAYENGAGWTYDIELLIPEDWRSGVYSVSVKTPDGDEAWTFFVIKEKNPGVTSDILVQVALSTLQAYNNWGGKAFYSALSTDGKATTLSFKRPYTKLVKNSFEGRELRFIRWLEGEGYGVEYSTSLDTHNEPQLQSNYKLFVMAGHDEYWSKEMRDSIEERIAQQKKVAIFSGNSVFWQVRFNSDASQMICYKSANTDPLLGIDDERVTTQWALPPVNRPENHLTGVGYRWGGLVNLRDLLPASEGYGGYWVDRSDHWVFDNTGLINGEVIGLQNTVAGTEVDGVSIVAGSSPPQITGGDGTPSDFLVLASTPAACPSGISDRECNGVIGIYGPGDGVVFNAATLDWSHGLAGNDQDIIAITKNVLDRFLGQDLDSDNVSDSFDNCLNKANPSQKDTDGDGYGNICDGDFNNDNVVNVLDLGLFKSMFFFSGDVVADLNGDDVVNSLDLGIFKQLFFKPPGPSGQVI